MEILVFKTLNNSLLRSGTIKIYMRENELMTLNDRSLKVLRSSEGVNGSINSAIKLMTIRSLVTSLFSIS